jgi:probable phosphoglycerate mutase
MTKLALAEGLTLYLCRHGETEANVKKEFQGLKADSPLTAKGRDQARTMGAIMRADCPNPAALAYVSSPYKRAITTMMLVREAIGLPPDDFTTDDRIREIGLGIWDGLTDDQARALDPAFYDKRMANRGTVRIPGGGENYEDVAKRVTDWVQSLKADTFAISHGGCTRIMRGLFMGIDWNAMTKLDETQGVVFRIRGSTIERFDPPQDLAKSTGPHPVG